MPLLNLSNYCFVSCFTKQQRCLCVFACLYCIRLWFESPTHKKLTHPVRVCKCINNLPNKCILECTCVWLRFHAMLERYTVHVQCTTLSVAKHNKCSIAWHQINDGLRYVVFELSFIALACLLARLPVCSPFFSRQPTICNLKHKKIGKKRYGRIKNTILQPITAHKFEIVRSV